jgi:hypothetical protein
LTLQIFNFDRQRGDVGECVAQTSDQKRLVLRDAFRNGHIVRQATEDGGVLELSNEIAHRVALEVKWR